MYVIIFMQKGQPAMRGPYPTMTSAFREASHDNDSAQVWAVDPSGVIQLKDKGKGPEFVTNNEDPERFDGQS